MVFMAAISAVLESLFIRFALGYLMVKGALSHSSYFAGDFFLMAILPDLCLSFAESVARGMQAGFA
ncbi:MAG: hypothetical protein P8Z31_07400 [Gammaproteobacteria bacterium]